MVVVTWHIFLTDAIAAEALERITVLKDNFLIWTSVKVLCHISIEFVAPTLNGVPYYTPAMFTGKCN